MKIWGVTLYADVSEMPEINHQNRSIFVALLTLCYLALLYSNTFNVPFILDDRANIVERKNLHITSFSIDSITQTFFDNSGSGSKLYRPLSSLSFAVNYYLGKFDVTGYHLVNLIIHFITSVFLFQIILILLKLHGPSFDYEKRVCIAGLAALLWASHPIQTQAVTYIVQRMASMAAMFYCAGLFYYLKYRVKDRRISTFVISLVLFLCAFYSKENAVIFPVGILLVELFFLEGFQKVQKNPVKCLMLVLCFVGGLLWIFFHNVGFEKIVQSYEMRPFTLVERLIVQPKVLLFHLSQLIYPLPERFSIIHTFTLTESIFSPLSNLMAIVLIVGVLCFAWIQRNRQQLFSFSILFFFSHHLVESSFLPLEIVFEHRNYLPSLFFFLPLSYWGVELLERYKKRNIMAFSAALFIGCSIVFFTGLSTYIRNNDWRSHESLWLSAMKQSPELIRPYSQLGWAYTGSNRLNTAKANYYFLQGVDKSSSYSVFEKATLWVNIARTYDREGNFIKAQEALEQSIAEYKKVFAVKPKLAQRDSVKMQTASVYYQLAQNSLLLGKIDDAHQNIDFAIDLITHQAFFNEKGRYYIWQNRLDSALDVLLESIQLNEYDPYASFLLGYVLTTTGKLDEGLSYLKISVDDGITSYGIDPVNRLLIAENYLLAGNHTLSEKFIGEFLSMLSPPVISQLKAGKTIPELSRYIPLFHNLKTIQRLSKDFKNKRGNEGQEGL